MALLTIKNIMPPPRQMCTMSQRMSWFIRSNFLVTKPK
jgi:hypothetical protein